MKEDIELNLFIVNTKINALIKVLDLSKEQKDKFNQFLNVEKENFVKNNPPLSSEEKLKILALFQKESV